MDAEQIIEIGKELYEYKRRHEKPVSDGEQLLFDACVAMKQLQAELDKYKEMDRYKSEQSILATKNYDRLCKELDKLQVENKRLREVFDHPNQDWPEQRYLCEIANAIGLLEEFAKIEGGGEYAFGVVQQLKQFTKRADEALKG